MTTVGDGGLGGVSLLPSRGYAARASPQDSPPTSSTRPFANTANGQMADDGPGCVSSPRDKQGPSFASDVPSVAAPVCIDVGTSMQRSSSRQTGRGNEGSGDDDDGCKVTRESEGTRTGHKQVQARGHQPTANVAGCPRMSLRPHKKRETDR
jgi:hypothetical protein